MLILHYYVCFFCCCFLKWFFMLDRSVLSSFLNSFKLVELLLNSFKGPFLQLTDPRPYYTNSEKDSGPKIVPIIKWAFL